MRVMAKSFPGSGLVGAGEKSFLWPCQDDETELDLESQLRDLEQKLQSAAGTDAPEELSNFAEEKAALQQRLQQLRTGQALSLGVPEKSALLYSPEEFEKYIEALHDYDIGFTYCPLLQQIPAISRMLQGTGALEPPASEPVWLHENWSEEVMPRIGEIQTRRRTQWMNLIQRLFGGHKLPLDVVSHIAAFSLPVAPRARIAMRDDEEQSEGIRNGDLTEPSCSMM